MLVEQLRAHLAEQSSEGSANRGNAARGGSGSGGSGGGGGGGQGGRGGGEGARRTVFGALSDDPLGGDDDDDGDDDRFNAARDEASGLPKVPVAISIIRKQEILNLIR